MAARWGTGEDTLTACNMEFFHLDTLNEAAGLSSGETLEVLQNCLDPSILSIFEDTPNIETKGLDEDSEATLLTALTEILDNVDDENLSPFDTLPDSDLLSGQKGREHSPLRRLLCLSRSPPEKDLLSRPISTGKSLPRIQRDSLQRSDGEEEDDGSLTLSPVEHDLSCDGELFDWKGQTLPLPVTFEQEGEDGVSISLGDLVRHMHPYCMAICLENDEGEQMLPEGGILLEVVDQGENGEPILAIPNMDLPVSLPLKEQLLEIEPKNIDEADEVASDSSEHIIVVDENTMDIDPPVKVTSPATAGGSEYVKNEKIVKRRKKDVKERSRSMRKKKKERKEQCQSKPVEGRVLRSGTVRQTELKVPTKPGKTSDRKREKKHKVPLASSQAPSSVKPKKINMCQSGAQVGIAPTTPSPEMNVQVASFVSPRQDTALLKNSPKTCRRSCTPTALSSQQPEEILKQAISAPEKPADSSAAPSAALAPLSTETFAAAQSPAPPQLTPPVCEALPPVATVVPEPKPKSLSLAEYRRLRQQKKPAPVEKMETNSTKWPSLPELPKELPPIPCLPDPRRPNPQAAKKEEEEVRPAWHPRGPAAPPTPAALLVPPAYMVAASSKVSAATSVPKPQTSESSKPEPVASVPKSMKESSTHHHAQPAVPSVHQSSSPASLNEACKSVSSAGDKCNPTLSGGNCVVNERSQTHPVSHKSVQLAEGCTKTTTGLIKPNAATLPAPNVPQKTTVVLQNVADVTAATTTNCPITAIKQPVDSGDRLCPSIAAQPSDSRSLEEKPVKLEAKRNPTTAVKPQKAKNPTQELIEAFTSEIGIEAADLTSLLEQFEETQAKEEHCVPEVSGRAVAVGNSSLRLAPEKTIVERVRANDLSSSAALTPPATPPHQMWKPLVPVALLGKSKAAEAAKLSPSKVIQIEARPLPSFRSRSKPTPVCAPVDPSLACMDHDYCLPNKGTSPGEPGRRWNVKQQSFITIKPINQSTTTTTQVPVPSTTNAAVATKAPDALDHSYVLETPDASPDRQETESTEKVESPRRGPFERVFRRHAASRTPSPASSPKERTGGRSRKRRRSHHSPSPMSSSSDSDSHSSSSRSRSPAPSNKRYRPRHSESSSSSSSRSSSHSSSRSSSRSSSSMSRSPPRRRRYSYSSSHSGSWSGSRSHSRSPDRSAQWRSRAWRSPSYRPGYGQNAHTCVEQIKRRKEKAIEERRVVYVGRIRGTMTQKELKERFSFYGEIEDCTLHFRDHGDNYGFITYYDTKDAFRAIENGSKLRKPDELPFDLCFGGRRQFCKSNYADLDSNRGYDTSPVNGKFHALDFDTLLKQAKQNQKR